MNDLFSDILGQWLPLLVKEIDYSDPSFVLIGDGWSLSLLCPWRVRRGRDLWFSWSSDNVADLVWELVGLNIENARTDDRGDPTFELSGNLALDVFPDSDFDPWVMRLPNKTLVGQVSRSRPAEG